MEPNSQSGGNFPGTTEVTLDELAETNTPETPAVVSPPPGDPATFRVEGDTIPEKLRGLSASQLAERASQLTEALRISEDARLAARTAPAPVQPTAPVAQPQGITQEALREAYEKDPLEAMAMMAALVEQRTNAAAEARMAGLRAASLQTAETQARALYKDDFALLGPEIMEVAKQVQPEALADAKVWEGIVSYTRGRNIDKIVEHQIAQRAATPTRADVQNAQLNSLPPRVATPARTPTQDDNYGLDATQLNICKVMNLTPAEYKKNMF